MVKEKMKKMIGESNLTQEEIQYISRQLLENIDCCNHVLESLVNEGERVFKVIHQHELNKNCKNMAYDDRDTIVESVITILKNIFKNQISNYPWIAPINQPAIESEQ